jgi:hypothetical protein
VFVPALVIPIIGLGIPISYIHIIPIRLLKGCRALGADHFSSYRDGNNDPKDSVKILEKDVIY